MMDKFTLPDHYQFIYRLDLQKDRKQALLVNGASLLIMIVLFVVGALIMPIADSFQALYRSMHSRWVLPVAMLAAILAYMVLHEVVHGVCFRLYSGKWGKFGFTGLYAYANSEGYYAKNEYLVIGLAPVVLFGLVFLLLNLLLPSQYFWPVYLLQMINLGGAAGDLYLSCFVLPKLPKDVLIRDYGVYMEIYAAK